MTRPYAPKLTNKQRNEAARMYAKGESVKLIAENYGIHINSVYGFAKARGMVRNKVPKATSTRDAKDE